MGAFSDYLENKLLDHVYGNVPFTSPTTVYLALFTAAPTDAGGGTEVSGNGYARKAVTFGSASDGKVTNTAAVAFTATGGGFGNIVASAVFDAATGGNMLAWKTIPAITINENDTLTFPIGKVEATLD